MAKSNGLQEPQAAIPLYRVWSCGPFLVERRNGTTYEPLPVKAWKGNNYARLLLKILLCCPGRHASRGKLLDILWPNIDADEAGPYLNDAVYHLRVALHAPGRRSNMLITCEDHSYTLREQSVLWVDADAALDLLKTAESEADPFPLVQKAAKYLTRGTFLEEEGGVWAAGRRATMEVEAHHCLLWLADLHRAQGQIHEARRILLSLLEEDPPDEEAARRLMTLCAQQQMPAEAEHIYQQLVARLAAHGLEPTEATRNLEQQLRSQKGSAVPVPTLLSSPKTGRTMISSETPLSSQESEPRRRFPLFWNVPYQRNPFFTGRETLLETLRELLQHQKAAVALSQHALCGLGGIGKTQTVLEYAYRYSETYQAVFWVKADSRENLITDFLAIATLLNLPERNAPDQTVTKQAIMRWLREHAEWLLIFDNADELPLMRDMLPSGGRGDILLTTRAQALGGLAHRLEVDEMSEETGALFLLRRAGIIGPDDTLEQATAEDVSTAREIVRELGGLPLALDQTGAYLEESSISLREYLTLYRQQRSALLKRRGGLAMDHPEPVATTWSISFSRVEQMNPLAVDILRLCAFLDPDAIPEEIFSEGASQTCPSLAELASDRLAFHRAVEVLRTFSLVRRNPGTSTLTLHRLVQVSLQETMDDDTQRIWAEHTIRAVNRTFPAEVTVDLWPQCQRLLPHVQACLALTDRYGLDLPEPATLFNQAGFYLRERALYAEAETLYRRALAIRERVLGLEYPDTAQVLYNLARLHFDLGNYATCEMLNRRALEIREHSLPPDHLDRALSLNSLAFTYYSWGIKYDEAEALFQRALETFERSIGLDHPRTSHCLSNLALLYATQHKYVEAERLLLQVQKIRDMYLPPVHLDTARSLQNLAWLYLIQGKQDRYEEARRLLERSLTIRETLLGSEHPQTAISLHNLALLLTAQEQYAEAEQCYQRVLAIRRKMMGANNPKALLAEKHYALLLRKMGRDEEAAQLDARLNALQEKDTMLREILSSEDY